MYGKHFHHYKYMGANFRHSRASNTKVNSLIWPKFELIREFMAVQATCKFDKDLIKIKGTIDQTRSNMDFFGSQGQVTPKWKVWSGRNTNSTENSVLVTCKFDEDPIKIECTIDKVKYGLFQHSKASNSDVNSMMWLAVELIQDFMAVLDTCKIDEDWIKSEVPIVCTTLSPLCLWENYRSRASNSKEISPIWP